MMDQWRARSGISQWAANYRVWVKLKSKSQTRGKTIARVIKYLNTLAIITVGTGLGHSIGLLWISMARTKNTKYPIKHRQCPESQDRLRQYCGSGLYRFVDFAVSSTPGLANCDKTTRVDFVHFVACRQHVLITAWLIHAKHVPCANCEWLRAPPVMIYTWPGQGVQKPSKGYQLNQAEGDRVNN